MSTKGRLFLLFGLSVFWSQIGLCGNTDGSSGPSYNPATLGDNFDKQQFVTEGQAAASQTS
jgi:hypothetical protein